jgi:hypothetical protein
MPEQTNGTTALMMDYNIVQVPANLFSGWEDVNSALV